MMQTLLVMDAFEVFALRTVVDVNEPTIRSTLEVFFDEQERTVESYSS